MKKFPAFSSFVKKPTGWIVVALISLFLLALCHDGEAAEAQLELGTTTMNVVGGAVVQLDTRFDIGPGDSQLAAGVFVISESEWGRYQLDPQAGVYLQLVDRLPGSLKWLEVGVGFAYQQRDELVVTTPFRFDLSLGAVWETREWYLPDGLRWRHRSSAGSSENNSGWDMVMLEWRVR